MSIQIGRASIVLTADTASFQSGMDDVRQSTARTTTDARNNLAALATHLRTASVAAGALAAATAAVLLPVKNLVKEQMELVSALDHMARVSNSTAVNMQKYAFAAKAVGIEQEKMGDIFKDTQDKVGDFLTTDGGELKDFFENIAPRIKVTAEEFRTLSGPEALQKYYDSLEKANIGHAEMVFYMESIADDASLLIPLLKNGGEGFKIWEEAAKNAGAVMDEKTIAATRELNASTKLLDLTYQGAKNQLTQAVIPVISDLAGSLIGTKTAANAAKMAGEGLVVLLKTLASAGLTVGTVFYTVGKAIGGLAAATSAFFNNLDLSGDPIGFIKSLVTANNSFGLVLDDTVRGIGESISGGWNMGKKIWSLGNGQTNETVKKIMGYDAEQEEIKNQKLGITGREQAEQREKEKEAKKKAESEKAKAKKEAKKTIAPALKDGVALGQAVVLAYMKTGLSKNQALALAAEVGRENDFSMDLVFGGHIDPAKDKNGNNIKNIGMLSWNGERGKKLYEFLKSRGLITADGRIVRNQAALEAQAAFSVSEMRSDQYRPKLKNYFANPNADPISYIPELAKYIGWAYGQSTIRGANGTRVPFNSKKHETRLRNHLKALIKNFEAYQKSGNLTQQQANWDVQQIKDQEQWFKNQSDLVRQIQEKFASPRVKILEEYKETVANIEKIAIPEFTDEMRQTYLKNAEVVYKSKLEALRIEEDSELHQLTAWTKSKKQQIEDEAELQRRKALNDLDANDNQKLAAIDKINHEMEVALSRLKSQDIEYEESWFKVHEHLLTSEEKVKALGEIERAKIMALVELDESTRKVQLLLQQKEEEEALENIAQDYQRELDTFKQENLTELERIKQEYDLKRTELGSRTDINAEQKGELSGLIDDAEVLAVAQLQQQKAKELAQLYAELGGVGNLKAAEEQYQARLDQLESFLEAEIISVEEAEMAKQMIRTQYAQDMLGGLAESSKAAFGEQSRAYAAMFAMQKGVAIAQASLAMYQNISQAMSKGFPANVPLIAQAMMQGMGIIANIKAIKNTVVGQAHDGIMSVPKSGTWNLEKGERVLPRHTAQNLDHTLANLQDKRQGETKIIINNYSGEKTDVQQMPNGDMMVTIGKMIDAKVDAKVNQRFLQARRQGGELYGR
ncbi:MAG: hypothetical protein ACTTGU_07665 [Moraxella sp.]